jgi:glutamyl-tRNA synthetase
MSDGPVRVRFAPSPTGLLHVGGLRTALYNWLLARQTGGAFVLRIEDTDQARYVEGAEQDIADALAWAGLTADEGPHAGGPFVPYRQSERAERYAEAARQLVEAGRAYVAFDTPDEIEAMRQRLRSEANPNPTYDASTRGQMTNALTLDAGEVERRLAAGAAHVVRLKVDPGETVRFHDRVRGEVSFETNAVDDQVLVKSDGLPTYHLANVVDDHAMEITHVVRGEEWLPSTPKHLLLYRALGWAPPTFAHLPLLLSPTGGKLSKRNAEKQGIPVSVRDYRQRGYEPEALVSFLALLGWNPGDDREQFTLEELVEAFSLERVHKAGAVFDLDKLNWLNGQVLRDLPAEEVARRAAPAVADRHGDVPLDRIETAARLLHERIGFARDLADADYLFDESQEYDPAGLKKRWKDDSARLVALYADRLEADDAFTEESTEAAMRALAEDEGVGFGRVIHPVRLAVTGTPVGAGMFKTLVAVGREATIHRLRMAADVLG